MKIAMAANEQRGNSRINEMFFKRKVPVSYFKNITPNNEAAITQRYSWMSVVVEPKPLNNPNEDSFHKAISSVLVTAQCFAIMPVRGITSADVEKLKFSWWSIQTIYTALTIIGALTMTIFCVLHLSHSGLSFATSSCTVFSLSTMTSLLLFLKLSTQWPALQLEWRRVEEIMRRRHRAPRLKTKFRWLTAALLLLALVEHLLANLHHTIDALQCACCNVPNVFQAILTQSHGFVTSRVGYAHWKGLLLCVISLIETFCWNYTDLFIILISFGLADQFDAFNQRLHQFHGQDLPISFWRVLREDYNLLADLTKRVDSCVNKIVLLSFASNLYFICYQMLHSMRVHGNFSDALYFYWSIIYILLKTCAVALSTASIHDQSIKPKSFLYSVPAQGYCPEVKRFLQQLTTDNIALTGMNFFSVTRAFAMTVAGTIVTYEVVLMQFNTVADLPENQVPLLDNKTEKCQWIFQK